ncbi:MAG: hypothetical protein ABI472_11380 [Ginsengibacter sp.]
MKSIITILKYLLVLMLLCTRITYAQHSLQTVKLVQYVLDQFTPGTVKMKSGETSNQNLNYNTITNEMVFEENGKIAAIAKPENVDTVYISDRKFIPLNNKFYEVLANGSIILLEEFTASVSEPGTSIGYGSTTESSATSSYQSLIRDGGAYALKLPDGFKIIPNQAFFILKDGKLEKIGNERQLAKFFPDKKDAIKDWVKKNNTTFSKRDDVIALIKQIE